MYCIFVCLLVAWCILMSLSVSLIVQVLAHVSCSRFLVFLAATFFILVSPTLSLETYFFNPSYIHFLSLAESFLLSLTFFTLLICRRIFWWAVPLSLCFLFTYFLFFITAWTLIFILYSILPVFLTVSESYLFYTLFLVSLNAVFFLSVCLFSFLLTAFSSIFYFLFLSFTCFS
jgi:hypothetical protein